MAIQSSHFRAETDKGRGSSAVLIREMNMVVNDLEALEAANAGFVDLTTNQTIEGVKSFEDGIEVGGITEVSAGNGIEMNSQVLFSDKLCLTAGVRTGAGAIDPNLSACQLTTTGANALTLAAPTSPQGVAIIYITMISDGGDGTLIPAARAGYASITFTAVGQSVILGFINNAWAIFGSYGVTIA